MLLNLFKGLFWRSGHKGEVSLEDLMKFRDESLAMSPKSIAWELRNDNGSPLRVQIYPYVAVLTDAQIGSEYTSTK